MDEKRFIELVDRAIERYKREEQNKSILPNAYFILPDFCDETVKNSVKEVIKQFQGYKHIVVTSNSACQEALSLEADKIVLRGDVNYEGNHSITVFPAVSNNLLAKAALCIENDFSSKWLAQRLAAGNTVYMYWNIQNAVSNAKPAYRKRLESYKQAIESYGVEFKDHCKKEYIQATREKRVEAGEKRLISEKEILAFAQNATKQGETIYLNPGDLVTPLAKDRARELRVSIVYQS